MTIAVMGAGSLGIVVGALLARSGRDVVLVDADEKNVEALNAGGARIVGSLDITVPVRAVVPAQMQGIYDIVLLLTKQTYNEAALTALLPHLGPDSTVCTLQNGIPEESVATRVGIERTIGGTVGFGATWREPGVSALTSSLEALQNFGFDIGEIDGRVTPRLHKVKDALSAVGGCQIVDNLMPIRWSKLLMNATFSGVSAALGCLFGDVLEDPRAMRFLSHIADETIKVARANGVRLAEMQGEDMELLELRPGETVDDKMAFYRRVWSRHAKLKASMLQDLEKGRKTEINQINGYVCQKGRAVGVATPCNDLVVELVSEAETTKTLPRFDANLERMRACLERNGL
jgi:2-dehydropantoate 2-reductase